jgi:peptidoglycan/LPS O-acetylase OafA/YrhL
VLFLGVIELTLEEVPRGSLIMSGIGYTWIALFYLALLLSAVLSPHALAARTLRSRPLRQLGRVSFALYLIHVPIYLLCHGSLPATSLNPAGGGGWLTTLLAFVWSFVLAVASTCFFEKPFVKAGHRLSW